jgi:hypothetical protein
MYNRNANVQQVEQFQPHLSLCYRGALLKGQEILYHKRLFV